MIGRTRGRTSLAWPLPASWSWSVPAETAAYSYRRSHDLLRARSLAGGTPSWSSLQSWPPSDICQTLWMPFVSRSENNEFETYRSFPWNPVISTNKSRHSDNRQTDSQFVMCRAYPLSLAGGVAVVVALEQLQRANCQHVPATSLPVVAHPLFMPNPSVRPRVDIHIREL